MSAAIGSLCSGYGGLDQGLSLALGGDTRTAWHVEYDKHPSAILAHRYPDVPNHGDVKTTDWTQVEPIDWLTAGYPCQPFSTAGKRKGVNDERHLWPDVARAVRLLRPRGVLLENVAAHLRVGFDVVLGDLAALGYDASWGVVRASDAGAPHGRSRIFVVATDADSPRLEGSEQPRGTSSSRWADAVRVGLVPAGCSPVSAADTAGAERRDAEPDVLAAPARAAAEPGERTGEIAWGRYRPAIRRWESILGRPAPRPTEPGRRGDRLSPRFVEWMMGLPDGWVTDVPGLPRSAQLKALGNGVVPQQAALACRLLGVTTEAVAA